MVDRGPSILLLAELWALPSPTVCPPPPLSLQAARSPAPHAIARVSQNPPSLTTHGPPATPPAPKVVPPPGVRPPAPCPPHSSWLLVGSPGTTEHQVLSLHAPCPAAWWPLFRVCPLAHRRRLSNLAWPTTCLPMCRTVQTPMVSWTFHLACPSLDLNVTRPGGPCSRRGALHCPEHEPSCPCALPSHLLPALHLPAGLSAPEHQLLYSPAPRNLGRRGSHHCPPLSPFLSQPP